VQQANELDDTTAFLEAELADFSTRTGTSKDDKPIKQRYYPKNPKIQKEINAKVRVKPGGTFVCARRKAK